MGCPWLPSGILNCKNNYFLGFGGILIKSPQASFRYIKEEPVALNTVFVNTVFSKLMDHLFKKDMGF